MKKMWNQVAEVKPIQRAPKNEEVVENKTQSPKITAINEEKMEKNTLFKEEVACRFQCGQSFQYELELKRHELEHLQFGINLRNQYQFKSSKPAKNGPKKSHQQKRRYPGQN